MGPKGSGTKISLDDDSGFKAAFLNKTFVKNSLKPRAEQITAEDPSPRRAPKITTS